ncbi:MAG: DUF1330 domain-containing protein [Deltaproteobacteria bacterium]|nr:DUF1330 domain-containing protein [Deltaproteobacteria bacterium]
MAAYIIVNIQVTNEVQYQSYRSQVSPMVQRFHGKYLVRGGAHKVLEGDWNPTRLVVLEFPSMADAERFYHSPEYKPLLALRQGAAQSSLVLVEGV